ncbi:type II CAAX endopeptidase family protein [Halogeometricum luteum]|uniref:CPBP family intramembrane metalloprotease n=1 Tax=Halogeometricum luteum TaxID=2950537 RepID=A0ABU2G014_9EURY|nr:type II CAAX endopeptidase family protein [Halogeometricum sp. S3BR5-2]MDS0293644.1 CPBP family intramembrane metalloprotease [Halogeometricum sp. S3BR5-2]
MTNVRSRVGASLVRRRSGLVGSWWLFLVVAVGGTWAFWLPAIFLGVSFDTAAGLALLLTGLATPGAAGVAFVYLVYDERGRADFWSRVTESRRVGLRWFAVILGVPVGVSLLAGLVTLLSGGSGVGWGEAVTQFGTNPLVVVPTLFFATLPPILEELGWRGYALDRLQLQWSALTSSVVLGVVWALWHLPLFFVEGSYQHDAVGFATAGFWLFMAGIVALSSVFTWIYNNTERSVLGIIALHGWVNFTAEVVVVPDAVYYPLWFALTGVIVAVWGAKTMTAADEVPHPPLPSDP